MFGLFLVLCLSGEPECYQPAGYVYPDADNCIRDIQQNFDPAVYVCLPVDGVIRSGEAQL